MGARIALRSDSPSIIDEARAMLPPASRPAAGGGETVTYSIRRGNGCYRLIRDGRRIGTHSGASEALEHLRSRLHETVALHSPLLFVHAGVVRVRGRIAVFPGVTHAGKSTLVAELVRQGAAYYSDEYAVFDELGRVHCYPKPLSLRRPGGLPPELIPAEQLGGKAGHKRAPAALVAALRYRPGQEWSVRKMPEAETLFALLENTLAARSRPEQALRVLTRVAEQARGVRGVRGEASGALPEIAGLLGV